MESPFDPKNEQIQAVEHTMYIYIYIYTYLGIPSVLPFLLVMLVYL